MPSTGSLTLNDYDGQPGIIGYNTAEVTAANLAGIALDMGSFRTAVEAVTLGVSIKSELSIISRFNASNSKSADVLAQRGNKWMVSYLDATEFLDGGNTIPNPGYRKSFTLDIPTADLSYRTQGQDIVWALGGANNHVDFDNLVSKTETLIRSPYSGLVEVQQIEAVTRAGG